MHAQIHALNWPCLWRRVGSGKAATHSISTWVHVKFVCPQSLNLNSYYDGVWKQRYREFIHTDLMVYLQMKRPLTTSYSHYSTKMGQFFNTKIIAFFSVLILLILEVLTASFFNYFFVLPDIFLIDCSCRALSMFSDHYFEYCSPSVW